jgi:type IV secretion system protein VirB10
MLADDQNQQQHKLDFTRQRDNNGIYNAHGLQSPASAYELFAGTIIPASLITGINSDLPGLAIAQVTQNLYGLSGTLLLPAGSKLIGKTDSVVAFGQSRALVVWQRIVMPNGTSIEIDNTPATDTEGYAGLEDEVDYHTWRLIKGVALSTLLGVGAQLSVNDSNDDLLTALRESAQDSANQAGQQITQRNLNIQPTLTIRPGWPLRAILSKDLVLQPYQGW